MRGPNRKSLLMATTDPEPVFRPRGSVRIHIRKGEFRNQPPETY